MKILVVRFSSLGDIILVSGVLRFLKKEINNLSIDILTYNHFADIFEGNPDINKLITIGKDDSIKQYLSYLYRELKDYDYIFDLHAKLSSGTLRFLTPAVYKKYNKNSIKRRLFVKYGLFKNQLQKHVVQKYFEPFGSAFAIPEPSVEKLRPKIYNSDQRYGVKGGIAVHPFASRATKEWPYFRELIDLLVRNGEKVNIIGADRFEYTHGNAGNFAGNTSLREMFGIIKRSRFLVTTDSGPMHAGTALDIPTLGIFGPTTREFGFYPIFKKTFAAEKENVECRPCHVHGLNSCPEKHFQCMKNIYPEEVMDMITTLLYAQ